MVNSNGFHVALFRGGRQEGLLLKPFLNEPQTPRSEAGVGEWCGGKEEEFNVGWEVCIGASVGVADRVTPIPPPRFTWGGGDSISDSPRQAAPGGPSCYSPLRKTNLRSRAEFLHRVRLVYNVRNGRDEVSLLPSCEVKRRKFSSVCPLAILPTALAPLAG